MLLINSDADLRTNDTSFNEVSSKRPYSDSVVESVDQLRERFRQEREASTEEREIDQILRPEAYGRDPEPERYPVNMLVTEVQWKLIEEALELSKKQSEGYIKRAQNNPSEGVRSDVTIDRHREKLRWLDDVMSRFRENVF